MQIGKTFCDANFMQGKHTRHTQTTHAHYTHTEVCRTSSPIKRAMWSDKLHHDGVLIAMWIALIGLVFDSTEAFLGRLTDGEK